MSETKSGPIVNVAEVEAIERRSGEHWGAAYKPLTPSMGPRGGKLGVNWMCVPPGRAAVPFHTHQLEDEVFYVLVGEGTLRYGDQLLPLREGDCVSCPANSGVAHQIANTSERDLIYLSIGNREPNEVCTYPDTGKVMVRCLNTVGRLASAPYMDGEPELPRIFELVAGSEGR